MGRQFEDMVNPMTESDFREWDPSNHDPGTAGAIEAAEDLQQQVQNDVEDNVQQSIISAISHDVENAD